LIFEDEGQEKEVLVIVPDRLLRLPSPILIGSF